MCVYCGIEQAIPWFLVVFQAIWNVLTVKVVVR